MLPVLIWLLSFILHIAILGILAYQVIALADLERDFINPHDATQMVNGTWPKEIALQGGLTLILLIGRLWLAFAIQLMVLAVNCYLIINGKHLLDVTEAFRQVAMARNIKVGKIIVFILSFVLTMYMLIESAVHHGLV